MSPFHFGALEFLEHWRCMGIVSKFQTGQQLMATCWADGSEMAHDIDSYAQVQQVGMGRHMPKLGSCNQTCGQWGVWIWMESLGCPYINLEISSSFQSLHFDNQRYVKLFPHLTIEATTSNQCRVMGMEAKTKYVRCTLQHHLRIHNWGACVVI